MGNGGQKNSSQNNGKNQNNNRNYQNSNWKNSKSKVAEIMEGILEKGYRTESKDILRKELV